MKKDPNVFIKHILECIELIEDYSKNVPERKFVKTQSLQDAIIRRLEIIGEAVKNLPNSFKAKHTIVPWKKIA